MGINIDKIKETILANRIRITDHADEEAEADQLTFDEIYFRLCMEKLLNLILMINHIRVVLSSGKHLAENRFIVWAYNKNTGWAVLITVYRPDPKIWIDCRERRK
jgi:hypothetical protein